MDHSQHFIQATIHDFRTKESSFDVLIIPTDGKVEISLV